MIKNIFLPEKIGNYYLFTRRIVGIDVGKTRVNAIQFRIAARSLIVEKCIEEPIEAGTPANHTDRAVDALKKVVRKLKKFDSLHTTIASNLVVFKELKLPFLNHEKIKMVINFEVEPLLPFSAPNAVIDFIITKQIPEEKSSEVLVAAVQKQHIVQYLQLFESAGLTPDKVIVDLFSLYGLYKEIPRYAQLTGSIVLLDLGLHSTRIAHIYNGQLRSIRSLGKGIFNVVKSASEELNIPINQIMEYMVRFGLEKTDKPEYTEALSKSLTTFWKDINFTLTSFSAQTPAYESINQILLIGGSAQIKGLEAFIYDLLQAPCSLFDIQEIIDNKMIIVKNKHSILHTNIISLSATLPSPITQAFNLLKDEFSPADTKLLIKQVITAVVLGLITLGSLLAYTIIETRKLNKEEKGAQQEAIKALQKRFKKIPKEEDDLEEAIEAAKKEVAQEESTWFAFSSQARASFLKYLLELTSRIDKESLGFEVDSITIAEGIMTLKAQVKNHEALKIFERELRQSKLFSYVEPQADPLFTMKITLVQNSEEV